VQGETCGRAAYLHTDCGGGKRGHRGQVGLGCRHSDGGGVNHLTGQGGDGAQGGDWGGQGGIGSSNTAPCQAGGYCPSDRPQMGDSCWAWRGGVIKEEAPIKVYTKHCMKYKI